MFAAIFFIRKISPVSIILLWLGLLTTTAETASVYKYVDENGVVSYTDQYARAQPFNPSFRTCLKHYQSLDSDRLL